MRHVRSTIVTVILLLSISVSALYAAEVKPAWQLEWDKTIEAAKQEGKVVAGIPASADLRNALNQTFSKRYPDIDIELATGRGPANASKIAAEHAAGVRYFDLLISGSLTPLSLLNAGILEPIEPLLILPEVKDPKRWYGGHVWADNAKKFLYSFQAYQSENFWHNTQLLKPDETAASPRKSSSIGCSARKAKKPMARRWARRRTGSTSTPNDWRHTAPGRRKIS
jgi:hypothetical protein